MGVSLQLCTPVGSVRSYSSEFQWVETKKINMQNLMIASCLAVAASAYDYSGPGLDTLFPPPTGLLRVLALDTASDTATASTAMARGLLYHSTLLVDPLKSPPPTPLLLGTAIRTLFSEPVLIPMESEITISHPHIWHILRLMNKFLFLA